MNHKVFNADGSSSNKRVFAFGSHELAQPDELKSGEVTSGVASANLFRLVIDELLVGNNLEEIACRSAVDDDSFARVPLGATPDDIARCAVADDVLPQSCGGPTAVCICAIAGGCSSSTGALVAEGLPVGVLDINQDGATDDTQMIAGSVGLRCGTIDVPISLENSFWNPSGDQNRPAQGGFDALGPAIILAPDGPLPTNLNCQLIFSDSVVDKQGLQVCAPPNGDVTQDCEPGDMGNFSFQTEVLDVRPTFLNGAMAISRTAPIVMTATVPLELGTVTATNITLVATTGPQPTFTVTIDPTMPQVILITIGGGGLSATTEYTLTVTQSVTDTFDQPPPAPQVFTFTTGT
ncbi:MAG: Ig-like domain-containing protein [Deltaproteobacteria bacterium]|nr:Ig-like domain-containing protein [Deltaproteobacteria bacterium]